MKARVCRSGIWVIVSVVLVTFASGVFAKDAFEYDRQEYRVVESAQAFAAAYEEGDRAAIAVRVPEYQATMRAIMEACLARELDPSKVFEPGDLICGQCRRTPSESMIMSLVMPEGAIVTGTRTSPAEREAFRTSGACPHCANHQFYLLTLRNHDRSPLAEVTTDDLLKLREYARFVATAWWSANRRSGGVCDRCNATMRRYEGYASGGIRQGVVETHRIYCASCADKSFNDEDLAALRKNPDYFGRGHLVQAREYSQWLRRTPAENFAGLCRERFAKNLPTGGLDLLSGERIPPGRGYQITGGDFLASKKLKQMYINHWSQTLSPERAEDEYWKQYVKCVIYPHNLAIAEAHFHFVRP